MDIFKINIYIIYKRRIVLQIIGIFNIDKFIFFSVINYLLYNEYFL